MSSITNKTKRARRSSPRLHPVLPYLTPELWSKVLERLPYGDIHGLITSDDPNLAIMPKAVVHLERIVVTRPEDLALRPPAGALARVKKLTAACWDDLGANPWYKRPKGAVPLHDLPIDANLGEHLEKLIDLISVMPNIQDAEAVGFGGGGCVCLPHGWNFLCHKLENLAQGWTGADIGGKCAANTVCAIVRGYQTGKLPSHISLTWDSSWKDLIETACLYEDRLAPGFWPGGAHVCAFCNMACKSLPFRILFPLAKEGNIDTICRSLTQECILQTIATRPGGMEFLQQSSLIKDIIKECERDTKEVACTYRGVPIIPGQSGYKDGESWKKVPCAAGAIHIPKSKLDLIAKLKDFGNHLKPNVLVDMLDDLVNSAGKHRGSDEYEIGTLHGRPFITQETINALNGLEIRLSPEKFVVFPNSFFIHRDNQDSEEHWECYYDMNGAPSDSEDDDGEE